MCCFCYVNIVILVLFVYNCVFFFFKQKTAYEMRISDWSSDVCSSDLNLGAQTQGWWWNRFPPCDRLGRNYATRFNRLFDRPCRDVSRSEATNADYLGIPSNLFEI